MVQERVQELSRDDTAEGQWITVAAAARHLGVSPRAVRGRIRRDTIQWKPGNTGKLVLIRPGDVGNADRDVPRNGTGDVVDQLREELMEARVAQALAEGEAIALRATNGDLRGRLGTAEARLDELLAE